MPMNALGSTFANVALVTLEREFGLAAATASVVAGYLIGLAVVIPASRRLGDGFGARRVFLVAPAA